MSRPLPCPFCGHADSAVTVSDYLPERKKHNWKVWCANCQAEGPQIMTKKQAAIAAWNSALRVIKESEMKVKKAGKTIRTLGVNRLARELGLTPAHVSQVMSGKRKSRRVSEAAQGRVTIIEHGAVRLKNEKAV